jgi:hypothetical protein
MRRRLLLIALIAAVVGISAATASGGARVVGNCTHSQIRPASVILFCGDANAALTRLHWTSFGGATAAASGQYTANDCKPDCAAGHVHSYPATAVFSKPKRCPDGHRDYRVAVVSFSSATRPAGAAGGKGQPGMFSITCPIK